MSAGRGPSSKHDGFGMASDGRAATDGTGRVVDLSQELYIATEQRNHKTLPVAEQPEGASAPASSGASRRVRVPIGQGRPGGTLCQAFDVAA